jgi:integrase
MATSRNPDRFLHRRGDRWHYVRRVPEDIASHDPRAPRIRLSLKTDDLAIARAKRDALEEADHDLWSAILTDQDAETALKRYVAASRRAVALGFSYRPAADIAAKAAWQEVAHRMEAIGDFRTPHVTEKALLGGEPQPSVRLTEALRVYFEDIAGPTLRTKSLKQQRKWRVIPERAVRTFAEVVEDKPIGAITREDAQKFYRYWRARIAPTDKGTAATHTASSGNRQVGALRTLYREYFEFMGDGDRLNPFAGLSFKERMKSKRPPFPPAWLKDKILKTAPLAGLNEEARGILLATIETGARPSELCNLREPDILVAAKVPHIRIVEHEDPEAPRELKTKASIRELPLVGVALAVFKKFPKGFPRYFGKEESACAAINKFLRENKLVPSPKHMATAL